MYSTSIQGKAYCTRTESIIQKVRGQVPGERTSARRIHLSMGLTRNPHYVWEHYTYVFFSGNTAENVGLGNKNFFLQPPREPWEKVWEWLYIATRV